MLVIGLTGGIGAGKTTVAAMFASRGAAVIDVDELGREVLRIGGRARDGVIERFGPSIVGGDGEIDRRVLAARVFGDQAALSDLTSISHPAINALIADRLAALDDDGAAAVVLDMAVLVESGLGRGLYDVVVVVEAPWELRRQRLAARGVSEDEAVSRRDAQATDAERRRMADYVIDNNGDLDVLRAQVESVWGKLVSPSPSGA